MNVSYIGFPAAFFSNIKMIQVDNLAYVGILFSKGLFIFDTGINVSEYVPMSGFWPVLKSVYSNMMWYSTGRLCHNHWHWWIISLVFKRIQMRSHLFWFQVQYLNSREGEITFQSITLCLRIENGSKKYLSLQCMMNCPIWRSLLYNVV